ncbi:type I-F CRISPR-associated endoribonuclease Cas6/Csy4 [Photobacterium damselae subsp. damselae]|uniref:type I-F CRISPR-associated endoribonuclease Cas6/Csy4 n=1 Tax=Photobacterium damselae TaxID=38293 RepID=UPI0015F6E6D1|nr:type I-F CRISPR-associated endoribonuclease Cas6/Csy4 [Photobacterium damselae]MBA5684407.1 type I-F CRISPR-associated endoribonuclease Cas6/Csy4 [Photobacterium damselae subsp. damselae]
MIDKRYFVVIRYMITDVDVGLLSGRCIKVLHGFLSSKNNQIHNGIGVAFPKWTRLSLGDEIAFVSTERCELEQLTEQYYFKMMESDNIFAISSIYNVPKGIPEVKFIRNQNIAKCFTGEKRRRLDRSRRRAIARGETFEPKNDFKQREIGLFHRIYMSSKSTNNRYLLHIQKEQTDLVRHDFNSYGFATNKQYQGTVPDFSHVTYFFS